MHKMIQDVPLVLKMIKPYFVYQLLNYKNLQFDMFLFNKKSVEKQLRNFSELAVRNLCQACSLDVLCRGRLFSLFNTASS